ncbi:hypothetical protein C0W35_22290 [Photobacterium kishitanii]|uniref:hypothetical protein n=1 Tax=Photobacterium kishitanii TaxID=318456 RepID=UPI000D151401|nr:hypothetical protein [Photobacterium kishitanii]PSU86453.1 hypothetical protein C0W35_22290 [Photobacterium kishitanii]
MEYSIENIEQLLEEKLSEALSKFRGKELRIIDIGVFPWISEINISFLFSEDSEEEDDIAAWRYFDYSKIFEGGWDQAKELAMKMNEIWVEDNDPIPFLLDFNSAATSEKVTYVINQFKLAPDFRVQVLNPDDSNSENFCA